MSNVKTFTDFWKIGEATSEKHISNVLLAYIPSKDTTANLRLLISHHLCLMSALQTVLTYLQSSSVK